MQIKSSDPAPASSWLTRITTQIWDSFTAFKHSCQVNVVEQMELAMDGILHPRWDNVHVAIELKENSGWPTRKADADDQIASVLPESPVTFGLTVTAAGEAVISFVTY